MFVFPDTADDISDISFDFCFESNWLSMPWPSEHLATRYESSSYQLSLSPRDMHMYFVSLSQTKQDILMRRSNCSAPISPRHPRGHHFFLVAPVLLSLYFFLSPPHIITNFIIFSSAPPFFITRILPLFPGLPPRMGQNNLTGALLSSDFQLSSNTCVSSKDFAQISCFIFESKPSLFMV